MIYFDLTKSAKAAHASGLNRVARRLSDELGAAAIGVCWDVGFREAKDGKPIAPRADDWLLTGDLFSEEERPGFSAFVAGHTCRLAAIFYDAIPLRHPHITWPQSVARHPGYMKLLSEFDKVLAISETSRADLVGFWKWQGVSPRATVETVVLGADMNGAPRSARREAGIGSGLLCVGILEPRKNQMFLMEVCESLWSEGLAFDLHIVGRVNPHFGAPVVKRIGELKSRGRAVHHLSDAGDDSVVGLYGRVRATVFPTVAEGCGLPLLESLWMGLPCVCSDLPVLRENAGGAYLTAPVGDLAAWKAALRSILTDDALVSRLGAEAASRPLPTWADTARSVRQTLS